MPITTKTALIIGGSLGVGRELSKKLATAGVQTIAVARNPANLEILHREIPEIETVAIDAVAPEAAARLLSQYKPDLVILAGGHRPKMAPLSDLSWEDFSATWNADTRIAFNFTKAALTLPMDAGGTVMSFCSGAALQGSTLSGGYAGAKKMQHFISNYGNWEARRKGLDLTFSAIYPSQLIAGTDIAAEASSAYAEARSMTPEQFMSQWGKPLTAELIAEHIVDLLSAGRPDAGAFTVSADGLEALAA